MITPNPFQHLIFKTSHTILLVVLLLCDQAHATVPTSGGELSKLAQHPIWRNLLRYESDMGSDSGFLSAVHSPEFFLSPQGRHDAYQELQETLKVFSDTFEGEADAHPLCRFPARYIWLKKQLGDQYGLPEHKPACPQFDQWNRQGQVDSISVVYATGYLDNPASFYGHTLLKWNSPQDKLTSKLNDTSLNYGAIIPDNENPVSYIFKGLLGGYNAGFSDIKYYFHDHNYGDNELRDLWEYELDLSEQEVALLVAHGWELLGKRYTYYFIKQNCAYRMAEFFNVIEGLDLRPDTMLWTFPQAVMQSIAEHNHHGKPLLKKITPHFSRQSELNNKYTQLTGQERNLVAAAAVDLDELEGPAFASLTPGGRLKVVETLIDYYQVVRDKFAPEDDPLNLAYKKVLAKRFGLPPGKGQFTPVAAKNPPHKGRKPSLVQVGATHSNQYGEGFYFNLRPAYYSALDYDFGHISNAQLNMANFAIDIDDEDWNLRHFDIVSIRKINALATGLPGDDSFAWNVRGGWEQATFDCRSCATFRIQSDAGYGWKLRPGVMLAGYVGGGVQDSRQQQGNWFVRTSGEAQLELSNNWRMHLAYEWRRYDRKQTHQLITADMRYRIDTNLDLRLGYRHNQSDELRLSFGYYW